MYEDREKLLHSNEYFINTHFSLITMNIANHLYFQINCGQRILNLNTYS